VNASALAIAATTATLRGVLAKGLNITNVTVRPLDTARANSTGEQVNLFLYQALPDAAWRNRDIPKRVLPGETAQPPLPLVLYYLVTTYGDEDNDIKSHALLGKAMSVLHDYPVLGATEIKDATVGDNDLKKTSLHEQVERVRISLQPLTFEEMSKLWTTFQTHYRTSAAYQVSVVLVESTRAARTPLPVLRQGEQDRGPETVAGALPFIEEIRVPLSGKFDTVDEVRSARTLPSAQVNDEVAIVGRNFSGGQARVRLSHPLLADGHVDLQPIKVIDETITFKVPNVAVGFYRVSVIMSRAGEHDRFSNELVLSLAPAITISPTSATAGNITLTVTTVPQILLTQRASLLFRNGEILPQARAQATDPLIFKLTAVTANDYVVRLRVDGVDSIPINRSSQVAEFDANQTLKAS
jgi:hypothetical protein